MLFAVVGHHARARMAQQLAERIGGTLFMDDGDHGALWGHRNALEWASAQSDRVTVVEDDALVSDEFTGDAAMWAAMWPRDLLGFYLGRNYPQWPGWQTGVEKSIRTAEGEGRDFVALPRLAHAVAYSLPAGDVDRVLTRLERGAADEAIGKAWGSHVIYPIPSLVDHRDTASVERHPDGVRRRLPRVAWRPPEGAS